MINITLAVTNDAATEYLIITPYTTWADLCGSISDSIKVSVTQVYYQDHEGDVITLSSEVEWNLLKQHCYTGWIHLSTDPSKTTRWVFDDSLNKPAPSHSTPLPSTRQQTKPNFTSKFERFGRIMDKYNDLIQHDEKLIQMMQTTATNITLQSGTVDLTQIETHLELLSTSTIDPPSQPLYPHYDTASLDDTPAPSRKKSLSITNFDLPSDVYDPPPPSYEPSAEKKKDTRRRHTHYGSSDRQIPTSSWGEWPAYSSLHPPPPPSPLATPSAPSEPALNEAFSSSTLHHHHHHHHHHSPRSLYPRPPVLIPALIKQTSRLLSHWIPPSDIDDRRKKSQEHADRKAQQWEQKRTALQEKWQDKKERRKGKQKEIRMKKSCSSIDSADLDPSPLHYPAIPSSLRPTQNSTDDIQPLTTSLGRLSTKIDSKDLWSPIQNL